MLYCACSPATIPLLQNTHNLNLVKEATAGMHFPLLPDMTAAKKIYIKGIRLKNTKKSELKPRFI
jgi:hypothetical protein